MQTTDCDGKTEAVVWGGLEGEKKEEEEEEERRVGAAATVAGG